MSLISPDQIGGSGNLALPGTHNTAANQTGVTPGANDLVNFSQASAAFIPQSWNRGAITPDHYDSTNHAFSIKLVEEYGTYPYWDQYRGSAHDFGYYRGTFLINTYYDSPTDSSFAITTIPFPYYVSAASLYHAFLIRSYSGTLIQNTQRGNATVGVSGDVEYTPTIWGNSSSAASYDNLSIIVTSAVTCSAGDTIKFSQTSSGTDGSQLSVVTEFAVSSSTVIPIRSFNSGCTALPTGANSAYLSINGGTPISNAYVKNTASAAATFPGRGVIFPSYPNGLTGSSFQINFWGYNARRLTFDLVVF